MKMITPVTQPAFPAFRSPARWAFTLIELLVVIAIIAILAGIAFPALNGALMRGQQTKATSNARTIVIALRMYASDNDGAFPGYTLDSNNNPTTSQVTSSNDAFCQLFPNYINMEAVFWNPKSSFCRSVAPDELTDNPMVVPSVQTLKSGENCWAYVLGLNDSSNSALPLIADAFNDPTNHYYVKDPTQKGGVWKASGAIVARCDGSASLMRLTANGQNYVVNGPNGGGATPGDIFSTANGANGWLGTSNIVVNPK